jgi:hypothetical protein
MKLRRMLAVVLALLSMVFARTAPCVQPDTDDRDGGAGYYFNVAVAYGDDEANEMIASLTAFKKAVDARIQATALLNIPPSGFSVTLESDHQLVAGCFNAKTGKPMAQRECLVQTVRLVVDDRALDSGNPFIVSLATRGYGVISARELRLKLNMAHGEVVSLELVPVADANPKPSFFVRHYNGVSWPGAAGFRIPVSAYGGVFTSDGLAFSLLAPAFSWGLQFNNTNKDISYIGLGLLAAPAIVEGRVAGDSEADDGSASNAFTLKRLAFGAYVDLGGYVWLGGGMRADLSASDDHAGMVFLVLGPNAYRALLP